MFYAAHKHEHSNAERARMAHFVPAQQEDAQGNYKPAMAFTAGGFPKFVFPLEEAVRLAHELVELIDYAREAQR